MNSNHITSPNNNVTPNSLAPKSTSSFRATLLRYFLPILSLVLFILLLSSSLLHYAPVISPPHSNPINPFQPLIAVSNQVVELNHAFNDHVDNQAEMVGKLTEAMKLLALYLNTSEEGDAKLERKNRLVKLLAAIDKDSHIHEPDNVDIVDAHPTPTAVTAGDTSPTVSDEHTANYEQCNNWRIQFKVRPLTDWGEMTNKAQQQKWNELTCDKVMVHSDNEARKRHRELSLTRVHSIHAAEAPSTDYPIIAIAVCTTTRMTWDIEQLSHLTLFRGLLPSLLLTAEPEFEYWVYITYDIGDLFYDQPGREEEIEKWYEANVAVPLREKNIFTRVYILSFDNVRKKPGPAFNYVLNVAKDDNVTYFYRVNDDTAFTTYFASPFVKTLMAFGWPYGVVGPHCPQGNTYILTHDFTHRTHMDIFDTYYPDSLSDWYMDDWITRVYGRKRTKRISTVEVSHAGGHGTRYSVDKSHAALIDGEVRSGHDLIVEYVKASREEMKQNNVVFTDAELEELEKDQTLFNVHKD